MVILAGIIESNENRKWTTQELIYIFGKDFIYVTGVDFIDFSSNNFICI